MNQRQQPYRSKCWLAVVGQIECCVLCGGYGAQAVLAKFDEMLEAV